MQQKKHTLTLLRRLVGLSSYPWLCFGDFNEILHTHEKTGGNNRNLNLVVDFRHAIKDCNLVDAGCTGYPFTWSNRRFEPYFIEERLDRFFYSKEWGKSFYDSTTTNLITWISDHSPVAFEVKEMSFVPRYARRTYSQVHYKDMWSAYDACKDIVRQN